MVIGSSSTIAQALIDNLLQRFPDEYLILISRQCASPRGAEGLNFQAQSGDIKKHAKLVHIACDYTESSIASVFAQLDQWLGAQYQNIVQIYICNGILHSDTIVPEKRIEDVGIKQVMALWHINALIPFLFVQALLPRLSRSPTCRIVVFSARVGSISDNRLGGWYGYRSSKAALNMLLKTAAVEYARRAKHVKLIAFHPGTTDTPLSKPFQGNVPADKLFTPDFVAKQCIGITEGAEIDGKLSYLDWQGKNIVF